MSLRRTIIDFLMGGPARRRRLRLDDSTSIVTGDTVICIADGWNSTITPDGEVGDLTAGPLARKGQRYSVTDVARVPCGAIAISLREFPGEWWHVQALRKARNTSIDRLRSLLNPSPEEVLAGTAGGNDYDVPAPSVAPVSSRASVEYAARRFCDLVKSFEPFVSREGLDNAERLVPISFAEDDRGYDDGEQAGFLPGEAWDMAARRNRVGGGGPHLSHLDQSPKSILSVFASEHGEDGHGIQ